MKILIASETFPPDINGAAKFSGQLAESLADNGYEVVAIAPSVNMDDGIEEKGNLKIFRLRSVPIKKIHPYFRIVIPVNLKKKIEDIFNDFQPDIVHIQNHFFIGKTCFKVAKQKNIPVVGTGHFMPDNLLEYFPRVAMKPIDNYMWKDFVKVYEKLDKVTSPSQAARELLKNIGLKNEVKVISNGINLEQFKKMDVQDSDYEKFGLDKNLPIFIFVGRLERDKNVDLILKALNLTLRKTEVQVVIVGKGRDEQKFKKLAIDLNLGKRAIFTGPVENSVLRTLLSLADVYIGSGSAELQGIAVMEGMAMSLPVLALNAVALPELVSEGVNGYLFEHDENDLSKKMLQIISDKEKLKDMGKQSRILIGAHHQPEIIKKFEELYRETIGKDK